ncbi:MAG: phosphate acyltransferase PlsX [Proteobacteria bacterium]|nr:phosphate acyltransferase PlsX [Pseudomonadota bacterium]
MANIRIAIDAMGGDHGPTVTVPAAVRILRDHPDLDLILVGDENVLKKALQAYHLTPFQQLSIHHAPEVVGMAELPSQALRNKKQSSMRLAIDLVKEGKADACVSAGNTGALMATARFVLKTLPGIDRPAIISELPTITGKVRMLDLGANVDSCAEHLFQFAVMGSVLTTALDNIPKPRVGLLNIGVEEIKGNDQVKRTALLLSDCNMINYIGYIEGDDIFKGRADVVVCDGFVGNVALKTTEGVASLIGSFIKAAFNESFFTKLVGLIAQPVLNALRKRSDPARYNGASLLGLRGIVIKSHGGANIPAFANAILEAAHEVKKNVPKLVRDEIAKLLQEGIL